MHTAVVVHSASRMRCFPVGGGLVATLQFQLNKQSKVVVMKKELWKHQCELIHAMDIIVRGFNDEEWVDTWLTYGVPDGTDTVQDVMDTYPNDEYFEKEFKDLQRLFVNLVSVQCFVGGGAVDPRLAENLLY